MAFAEQLVALRTERGLSQWQLAEATSLSVRALGDLERGETRRPRRATVIALADTLGLAGDERDAFLRLARQAPPPRTRVPRVRAAPLPGPTASVIGRDHDIAGVAELLGRPGVRLVTVTGVAGVGTSTVALHAARRVASAFDSVAVVDLARVTGPADMDAAVADTLATAGRSDRRNPRHLRLLDGFRHGDAAAAALAELLSRRADLHLILTAGGPVRLRGEHLWPLEPLPEATAAALLGERLSAVRPGFGHGDGGHAVLSLSRRLGGLPLAIELAAALLRTADVADLAEDLDARPTRPGPAPRPAEDPLRQVVRTVVGRLPARDRERLVALAAMPGGARPVALRAALDRAGCASADLAASLTLLAASGLVTVRDEAGAVHVRVVDSVARIVG
jgi:transcriptional regulator with XRE-family HTH domain